MKCTSLYKRKLITGLSVTLPFTLLLLALMCLISLKHMGHTGSIFIELKPEPIKESDYPVYRVYSSTTLPDRLTAKLNLESKGNEKLGPNFDTLHLEAVFVDKDILRVSIQDSRGKQWQVNDFNYTSKYSNNEYDFQLLTYPFSFTVIRKSDGKALFNSAGMKFYYSERYIELETEADSKRVSVGITTDKEGILLRDGKYPIWPAGERKGHHPFYMELTDTGAHGVFMHNFNAMEITYTETSMNFKMTGGIIDLFVLLGKNGEEVTRNYHKVIGLPKLPQFQALGYFCGAANANSVAELQRFSEFFENNSIPFDGLFLSQVYYNATLGTDSGFEGLGEFSGKLHQNNRSLIAEVPSGISLNFSGLENISEVLMPISSNTSIGRSSFIDWFHPKSAEKWHWLLTMLSVNSLFDGIRLTSNEITTTDTFSKDSLDLLFIPEGISLDNYSIPINTVHYNMLKEIDLHSLWADMQIKSTLEFLEISRRAFIVSSNTRAGSKAWHAFSNHSSWDNYRKSISDILTYEAFGVRSGSNVCGLSGSNSDLCLHWHKISVFYPLMLYYRDSQDSVLDTSILNDVRSIIELRYSLSLYIYSLHFECSLHGGTVMRPMIFEFFNASLANYPEQIMLGSSLFGIFTLFDKSLTLSVYFPAATWYNLATGALILENGPKALDLTKDTMIFIRGGHIIPYQSAVGVRNIIGMRSRDIQLMIALDEQSNAKGAFYIDDGINVDSLYKKAFTKVIIKAELKGKLMINIASVVHGYTKEFGKISVITVFGCKQPNLVRFEHYDLNFEYKNEVLTIFADVNTFEVSEITVFI